MGPSCGTGACARVYPSECPGMCELGSMIQSVCVSMLRLGSFDQGGKEVSHPNPLQCSTTTAASASPGASGAGGRGRGATPVRSAGGKVGGTGSAMAGWAAVAGTTMGRTCRCVAQPPSKFSSLCVTVALYGGVRRLLFYPFSPSIFLPCLMALALLSLPPFYIIHPCNNNKQGTAASVAGGLTYLQPDHHQHSHHDDGSGSGSVRCVLLHVSLTEGCVGWYM